MKIDSNLRPADLMRGISRLWELSADKIRSIERHYDHSQGSPVVTRDGRYTSRGWTEWTQGFQYGSAILQFDATGDQEFLTIGRDNTVDKMSPHLTHAGVHDHGFNNVSTYGALLRLAREGRFDADRWQTAFYELALKCSGAVQARRWTATVDGGGYIYSFNGPHSLFVDTIRSLRSLALAWQLGQPLMVENDRPISLLDRLIEHARATCKWNVYYGQGRDAYDVRGRVAHESIFNLADGGRYRCPSSQQGYSALTTWTRGLAWVLCGLAEDLEFLAAVDSQALAPGGGRESIEGFMLRAARAVADHYIEISAADGVCYWDSGAPELDKLGDYRGRPADPFNDFEPVDSSAAAIAAQGLLRLGHYLAARESSQDGQTYFQAGLTVLASLLSEPYLSTAADHQGLILHSVYHLPNGWDQIPPGRKVPCGQSSMWGDYHAREAALYVQRIATGQPYLKFFL
jgi:hypothetical protein